MKKAYRSNVDNGNLNEYDKKNNNIIHFKTSYGDRYLKEYDKKNNIIHFKTSYGYESSF
jgi:hypothetical protein